MATIRVKMGHKGCMPEQPKLGKPGHRLEQASSRAHRGSRARNCGFSGTQARESLLHSDRMRTAYTGHMA